MSKELEALEVLLHPMRNENLRGNKLLESEKIVRQALTPPTSEEVCQALENYFGYSHYYQDNFFYRSDGMKYIWAVKRSGLLEIGHSYETLPPHLIIMIGKFYKKEVKKNV